ncbi:TRAM domain-containing protein [Haladaptatus caseinilyticus]|uniref:TRAM domain-containing protein n=1 Tax=Haladaptatus caseinilyticus TaxID=2993314 RepID=UPI00224AE761|nr:TRAM domain-containing protein [Haladaptatus caseinilyticus]
MHIPDELLSVFTTEVDEDNESYTITIPKCEITKGDAERGETYRVAILDSNPGTPKNGKSATTRQDSTPKKRKSVTTRSETSSKAPVEEGDRRTVEIEGIGDQGDGIARVDQGYVIIVPDTEKRDRVTIEITDVTETVAFAEVVERKPYYE